MRNSNNRIMFDCWTSAYSVYMEDAVDLEFRRQYKGVIVNARSEGGYGHFAIRKPITFWFKLPKFLKKLFPYRWIMWKNDREEMSRLSFIDANRSINLFGYIKNRSYRTLTFNKETYEDLKSCIPAFPKHIGYKFTTEEEDGHLVLVFDSIKDKS